MLGDENAGREGLLARIQELEREVAELRSKVDFTPPAIARLNPAALDRLLAYRELLEHLPDFIAVLDRQQIILYLNRTIPGRKVSEMIGTSAVDSVPGEQQARYCAAFEQAWTGGEPQCVSFQTLSGRFWESRFVPVLHEQRSVLMLATSVEVTQQKLAEQALRESEGRLRLALEASRMGTWSWDMRQDGLIWDDILCRIFGIVASQAPRTYEEYVSHLHPEDRPRVETWIARALQLGAFDEFEHRIVRPDGEVRHVFCTGAAIVDGDGRVVGLRGGVRDVTEQKLLEERLLQAQKMDAVGQLTAGVAHNFNNLLSIILPNIALCQAEPALSPRVAERLSDVEYAAERAAELVRQLMFFARPEGAGSKEVVHPARIVRRTVEMCRMTFEREIALALEIDEPLPPLLGNASQLEQVILNVCLNARDALREAHTPAPRIRVCLRRGQAGEVSISVEDNGPGLDEATRSRMFEPFFTTKSVGRGTGLGLASAYAVVRDHGGSIRCSSALGHGATLQIDLPAAAMDSALPAPLEPSLPSPRGSETLLLVDDEPGVRRALRAILEAAGYQVLEAGGGHEAIAIFEQERLRIAALLVDRSMPSMSGEALLVQLRSRGSRAPAVLLSGYPAVRGELQSAASLLVKPVDGRLLLSTVRHVLDSPALI